jgi:hypothetical protein
LHRGIEGVSNRYILFHGGQIFEGGPCPASSA